MPSLPVNFQYLTFGSSDHTNEKEDCPSTWPLLGQNDEISGNIELLQPYAIVAVDVLLELG